MSKPDLSVAIIFKNEIRCLERCLKSLQPLRERISLQIVMADTGSTDGSRAVAERYADVLIDFPWRNDFSAARNASLERCDGRWTLVVDCDEWLDSSIDELVLHLHGRASKNQDCAVVTQRNYMSDEMVTYQDFHTMRLLNMASRPHYEGAIHETPVFSSPLGKGRIMKSTILHHDGYIMLNNGSEAGREKNRRNRILLEEELTHAPDDLRLLSLYLDCSRDTDNYLEKLRHAVDLIEKKGDKWDTFGPKILSGAVSDAFFMELPEYERWRDLAFQAFPHTYHIRIDLNFLLCMQAHDQGDSHSTLKYGLDYLDASRTLGNSRDAVTEVQYGPLVREGPVWGAAVSVCIAEAYCALKQYCEAESLLANTDFTALNEDGVRSTLLLLGMLYVDAKIDISPLLTALWRDIHSKKPNPAWADKRVAAFLKTGTGIINTREDLRGMFLPLQGQCILGDADALLACKDAEDADMLLASVDEPETLPAAAFIHALKLGAEFPYPRRIMTSDQIAAMAQKLLIEPNFLRMAAKYAASAAQTEQEILWAYALARVALNQATSLCNNKGEKDSKQDEEM